MAIFKIKESMPPPLLSRGLLKWARDNLFSSYLNIFLSFLSIYLIYLIVPPLLDWMIFNATWSGSKDDIVNDGARWIFIFDKLNQFIYGFYPYEQYWRVNLAFFLFFVFILIAKLNIKYILHIRIFLLFFYPCLAFILIYGGFGLEIIPTHKWGGLLATLCVAMSAIIVSFPLGILVALGRVSSMPVIKLLCIGYIEFIRGVPLITLLFMASIMLPLFLPDGVEFDKLLRALVGLIIFQAPYIAEVVRGGLQGVPKGQYEASISMGLGYTKTMILVILPQALKISIPNLVGSSIALFKDTSLLLIIGIFDILSMVTFTTSDPKWLGFSVEGYVFVAIVYWIFCFSMSFYSQRLEQKLNKNRKLG